MDESVYQRVTQTHANHWWFKARILIFESLIKTFCKNEKINILDYGCGVGSNINMLKDFGKVDVFEPHHQTAQYVKKKFKIKIINRIKIKYDLIILTDVIEHIKNEEIVIAKLVNSLKKNGHLFITVPAFQILFSSKDKTLHHYRRYNTQSLKKLITDKKSKIVKLSYFNFFLFTPIAFLILVYKIFNIKFINKAETVPLHIINYIMYKIFSFEKFILKLINFPFGLSLLMIIKKN
jgi:2-polyprenyl-3-methyl-5-hydroxy-6-metoxy-1,4-benzoquinol methylase